MITDPNKYLEEVLRFQTLNDDGPELTALRKKREEVENFISDEFASSKISIRYGGSKAKGTMIRESYDLDLVCYFSSEETNAGETLEEIYKNLSAALKKVYFVVEKTSALRLSGNDQVYSHVDVVPGRFVDTSNGDVFIYQKDAEKCRMKTNLDTHISHIRDSGFISCIRLMKLWSIRNGLRIKTFVLELMVIDLLKGMKNDTLKTQLVHVLTELRDDIENIHIVDPANPSGNDLTSALDSVRSLIKSVAQNTLRNIDDDNWENVFGKHEKAPSSSRATLAAAAISTVPLAAKPWASE